MTLYITEVHYDENYKNNEVISDVKFDDGAIKTKNEVIRLIARGFDVYTVVSRKLGDHVHVVNNKYLRTDGNEIESDNLGNLLRF